MTETLRYLPIPADTEDLSPIARLPARAFGFPVEAVVDWLTGRVGRDNVRIVTRDGRTVGTTCRVPMGLYLGGREVPQLGVLGVAVAPEARGAGVARWMMRESVREMHADGYPLSALYSAMHPLYRRAGWENAGVLCDAAIPAGMIESTDHGAGWREITDDDMPAVHACYEAYARDHHGMMVRGDYIWRRVREPRSGAAVGFLAENDRGGAEAYCFYVQEEKAGDDGGLGNAAGARMTVTDLAWCTPRGFERIRGFLRGFSSIVGEIRVSLPPSSPLLLTLPDRRFTLTVREPWMLRVLDVKAALESRGYARGLTAELTLEIEDDIIESNNARWTLRVKDGRAAAEPGGSGSALRCHVRDLVPIYTGYMTPAALRSIGRVDCADAEAALAASVFSGGAIPAMVDMF